MTELRLLFGQLRRARGTVDDGWAELEELLTDDELDAIDAGLIDPDAEDFLRHLEAAYDADMHEIQEHVRAHPFPLFEAWDHCLLGEIQLITAESNLATDGAANALEAGYSRLAAAWQELALCIDQSMPKECPDNLRPFVLLHRLQARTENLVLACVDAGIATVAGCYDDLAARVPHPYLAGLLHNDASMLLRSDPFEQPDPLVRSAADLAADQRLVAALAAFRTAVHDPDGLRTPTRIAAQFTLAGLQSVSDHTAATAHLEAAASALAGLRGSDPGLRSMHTTAEAHLDDVRPLPSVEALVSDTDSRTRQMSTLFDEAIRRADAGRSASALPLLKQAYTLAVDDGDAFWIASTAERYAEALAGRAHRARAEESLRGDHRHPARFPFGAGQAYNEARIVALVAAQANHALGDAFDTFRAVASAVAYSKELAALDPRIAVDSNEFRVQAAALRDGAASEWTAVLYAHIADLYFEALPNSPIGQRYRGEALEEFVATGGGPEMVAAVRESIDHAWAPAPASSFLEYLDNWEHTFAAQTDTNVVALYDKLTATAWFTAIADLAHEQRTEFRSDQSAIRDETDTEPAMATAVAQVEARALLLEAQVYQDLGLADPAATHLRAAQAAFGFSGDVLGEVHCGFLLDQLGEGRPDPGPGLNRDDLGPEH